MGQSARIWSLVAALFWIGATVAHAAGERVALVIGNSQYRSVAPLVNPVNDSRDLSEALARIGFEVDTAFDLTNAQLSDALRRFHRKASGAEIAIVYYAGHGIEVERRNYLIPVDAELETAADVFFEAVPMENALLAVEGASKLSLVILDACRNNPFADAIKRVSGTRSVGRGLALVEPSGNSIVAYAAKGGTTALDGEGENSPYAAALIEALQEPNVEVSLLFRKVRDDVLEATGGAQEPFVYGSLSADELYLNPSAVSPESGAQSAHLTPEFQPAFIAWTAIQGLERGENQRRALRAYVEEFAGSPFAGAARVMLQSYGDSAPAAPVASVPTVPEAEPVPVGSDVPLSREERRLVQKGLAAAGFSPGGADGVLGPRSRAAIVSWQDAQGMRVTSFLNREQADALIELGRSATVATIRPPAAVQPVTAAPAQPQTVPPAAKQPAPSAKPVAPKPAGSFAVLHYALVLTYRDDGRDVERSFNGNAALASGTGRFKAKYSEIGKLAPFTIDFTHSGSKLSYAGQLAGKSFGGSMSIIDASVTKRVVFQTGGTRYTLRIRGSLR